MQIRFAVLATALLAACYGCATENPSQDTAAGAAAANTPPAQPRDHTTLTGSRLPPMDDGEGGTSMVQGQSGSDYMHDRNSSVSPKQ